MADFSMNLKSLSLEAQKFMCEKDIENGDGIMTTSERDKLAQFLSGNEPFPDEYISVKDELTNFARQFDVASSEQKLSKKEKASVRGNMSENDKNAIDSIRDYSTMKAVADGTLKGYTPNQREYAQALLEDSSYAREMMLREENGVLRTKNQELLAENNELRTQIEELKRNSNQAENDNTTIMNAQKELSNIPDEGIKNALQGSLNNMSSLNDTIINTCKQQEKFIESFEKGNISESSLKKSLNTTQKKIKEAQDSIENEKQKARKTLEQAQEAFGASEIVPAEDTVAGSNAAGATDKIVQAGATVAGSNAARATNKIVQAGATVADSKVANAINKIMKGALGILLGAS